KPLETWNRVLLIYPPPNSALCNILLVPLSRIAPNRSPLGPHLLFRGRMFNRVIKIGPLLGTLSAGIVARLPRPSAVVVGILIGPVLFICSFHAIQEGNSLPCRVHNTVFRVTDHIVVHCRKISLIVRGRIFLLPTDRRYEI